MRLYAEKDRLSLPGVRQMVHGTVGLYQGGERPIIWVEASRLADPPALVATLSHEACHELLLGAGALRLPRLLPRGMLRASALGGSGRRPRPARGGWA